MKELALEEMKQVSGGLQQQKQQFGPGLIAEIILRALFFDFGAERAPVMVTW